MAVVNPQSRFPSSRWPLENVLSAESTLATTGTSSPGPPSPSPACRPALNVFRAAGIGDVDVISSYLSGGGNPNKTGKVGPCGLYCRKHFDAYYIYGSSIVELGPPTTTNISLKLLKASNRPPIALCSRFPFTWVQTRLLLSYPGAICWI